MTNPAELFPIVNRWYQSGSLLETEKPAVQAAYTALTGDPGQRCRTCPDYWNDVLHALRYHLKQTGFPTTMNEQQYMIRPDVAYLNLHGVAFVYINRGAGRESDSARYLTDAIAKRLLEEKPELSEVIIKNPDYQPKKKGAVAPKADELSVADSPAPSVTPDPDGPALVDETGEINPPADAE